MVVMVKRVQAVSYGGPEVLELAGFEPRALGEGDVLIEVRAAGMNPADVKGYSGAFGRDESKLPRPVGSEVAGVVLAVGPAADGPMGPLVVGQEVVANPVVGGWAEQVVAKAHNVYPKPPGMEDAAAANLLLVGTTAAHLLVATGVGPGATVLIHGASGAVGLLAAQLARLRGAARVIGTAGPRSFPTLERFGVEPVAYGDGLEARLRALAPDGVTAALDTAGTDEALATSLALADAPAHVASIANFSGAVQAAGAKLLGSGTGADPGTETRTAAKAELVALADEGALEVVVARTFPLAEFRAANDLLASGHPGGKLALIP
jgi:NADPH:quinone reductase